MSVWLTGDIHGDPGRLGSHSFYEQKGMTKNDCVIILGDFGIVWNSDKELAKEKYWLDWLEDKPFTTAFVDGNHDNIPRINSYPIKKWNGGSVHEIRPHVLHLIRGEVFTIEGSKFFVMGGASSHDISNGILDCDDPHWKDKARWLDVQGKHMYRIKGLSWWEEELPSEAELKHGFQILQEHGNSVDYILSHSPSTSELYLMGGKGLYESDNLTNYLEEVKAAVNYRKHYFGHMHVNCAINDKDICLYEQIVRII